MQQRERGGNPTTGGRTAHEVDTARANIAFVQKKLANAFEGNLDWKTKRDECPVHGPYEAIETATGWTGCPACQQEEPDPDAAYRREETRRAEKAKHVQAILGGENYVFPPRFRHATLDNYAPKTDLQQKALEQARSLAERVIASPDGAPSLVISGTVGAGKTHLGYGMVREVMRASRSAYRQTVQAVLDRLKESYSPREVLTPKELKKALVEVDLLVLDEVGKLAATDHNDAVLSEIIDKRWENEKATVLITNLRLEEMGHALGGDPAVSRIFSSGYLVKIDGDDHRFSGN